MTITFSTVSTHWKVNTDDMTVERLPIQGLDHPYLSYPAEPQPYDDFAMVESHFYFFGDAFSGGWIRSGMIVDGPEESDGFLVPA